MTIYLEGDVNLKFLMQQIYTLTFNYWKLLKITLV